MTKNNKIYTVHASDEWMRKFLYVAEREGRTPNNQFLFLLRQSVSYYERTKGKITPDQLAKVDMSGVGEEEKEPANGEN